MLKTLISSTLSFGGASRHTARLVARPRIGELFARHATLGSGPMQPSRGLTQLFSFMNPGPSRLRSTLPQRQPPGGYQKHQRPPLPRYVYYLSEWRRTNRCSWLLRGYIARVLTCTGLLYSRRSSLRRHHLGSQPRGGSLHQETACHPCEQW